ncbi:methylated-DNA--[protein]-cysteine S-methyltransferase [Edaphobacter sp.]|uniref:methylated-DNA--[protein]-cysteine S-methyltransferase n=1 Tax=Edaphobacter sp. TaxID=1934404 RepID=UPI002D7FB3CC|nr:methylated-DNA--[protein]-cysteine S-methyltransferase [Edaphobacter sp.]
MWSLLQTIPYGETRSCGELAELLGNRLAIPAVGLANGRNPISIIIPCHRVVGSNGSLTGYAGGLRTKASATGFRSSGSDIAAATQSFVEASRGTRQRYHAAMVR